MEQKYEYWQIRDICNNYVTDDMTELYFYALASKVIKDNKLPDTKHIRNLIYRWCVNNVDGYKE